METGGTERDSDQPPARIHRYLENKVYSNKSGDLVGRVNFNIIFFRKMYGCRIPKMPTCSSRKGFTKLRHTAGAACVRELRDVMQSCQHTVALKLKSSIYVLSDRYILLSFI